jgi:hypothetical protein
MFQIKSATTKEFEDLLVSRSLIVFMFQETPPEAFSKMQALLGELWRMGMNGFLYRKAPKKETPCAA